jgi:Protein of unknown function (DUF3987)/CHC2 zinc finger
MEPARFDELLQYLRDPQRPDAKGNVKVVCPFHADVNPSMNIHPAGGVYCFGCKAQPPLDGLYELFVQRRLSYEVVRGFQIRPEPQKKAWRYPILGPNGKVLAWRYRSYKRGRGGVYWWDGPATEYYGLDVLPGACSTLWLVEGDSDLWTARTATIEPAIAFLAGAGHVPLDFAKFLEQRQVTTLRVVYDNDKAGKDGATQVAQVASSVCTVFWCDIALPNSADLTDLWAASNYSSSALAGALDNCGNTFFPNEPASWPSIPTEAPPPMIQLTEPLPVAKEPDMVTSNDEELLSGHPVVTWLDAYLGYCDRALPGVPRLYNLASGLVILSTVVGRTVTMRSIDQHLITNFWCLLVGPTRGGKTRAMRTAVQRIHRTALPISVINDFTPEALATEMSSTNNPCLIYRDEISGFFKAINTRDYMKGTKEELDRFHSGDRYRRVLRSGPIEIQEPFVTLLGGTTNELFEDTMSYEDLYGGFLPRLLVAYTTEEAEEVSRAYTDISQSTYEQEIEERLKTIYATLHQPAESTLIGGVVVAPPEKYDAILTDNAMARWNRYIHDLRICGDRDPRLKALHTEMANTTVKLAILAAFTGPARETSFFGTAFVHEPHMAYAIKTLEPLRKSTASAFLTVGHNEFERRLDRVLGLLRRQRASRAHIMNTYRLAAQEMETVKQTLLQRGAVRITYIGTEEWYDVPKVQ